MKDSLTLACLPEDRNQATLVGRAWVPDAGPTLVTVRGDDVLDLSSVAPTMSQLLEMKEPVAAIRDADALPRIGSVAEVLRNSDCDAPQPIGPRLLAPCDLQALKASGVTFVSSLLERVIEEQTRGDPSKAEAVRKSIVAVMGNDLAAIRPGSDEAARLKLVLIEQKVWSQYLEVGIGPDAEIFTKSQPMSAVGLGAEIGIHPKSEWNNPEPEVVLRSTATARSSASRSATMSTCATSKGAARCCWGRRRTTTRRARSGLSSGCSTSVSAWMTCASARSRCASPAPTGSS
jgi:fumarylacetoacetate (FAA) hydrolase family protein